MMRSDCLIIVMLFLFWFAPLYSAISWPESPSRILGKLPLNLDVNGSTVKHMARFAILEYNSWVNMKLRLVKVLSCREKVHFKESYIFALDLLAKDDEAYKTKKYLAEVHQKRRNRDQLILQTLLKFELAHRLNFN
ncbi:hypothetical protein PIB30_099612 [Stylosanthes scabra]|uniref:Cystatin domain-containing protein n=1 Tax=Stylosanthes scabra TaxID=79078 RepID=A0ABU6TZ76_9FABA|nr:hypothetical protein [Stylosanthes scabra]